MLFMVLGVIGPGLFQLQPPQWFGTPGDGYGQDIERAVTGTVTAVGPETTPMIDEVEAPARPATKAAARQDISPLAKPESPAPVNSDRREDESPARTVVAAEGPNKDSPNKDSPNKGMPAIETPGDAVPADGHKDSPIVTASTTPAAEKVPVAEPVVPQSGDPSRDIADAPPERPAVAARRSRPAAPPENAPSDNARDADAAAPTQTASLAPRTAALPTIPTQPAPPSLVPRDFAKIIPQSHLGLPVKRQKESFIAITLPLILAANEEISQRRDAIMRAVSRGDRPTVERWARLYRVKIENRPLADIQKELLLRADFVPVSLALAQAAIESGWGTSRFALQGNALFGQWAWQKDAGLKPTRASNSNAVVRSFPNLFGSVRAYMHNLNTHPRYAAFRARRHLLRGRTQSDLGYQLSNFLDGYAEIGEVYVAKLKTLIRFNDLGKFETARLR